MAKTLDKLVREIFEGSYQFAAVSIIDHGSQQREALHLGTICQRP